MFPALFFAALLTGHLLEEPDGSRTVGVVPPFHGAPEPPAWLRATSHAMAAPHCRHYVYEAYGDALGDWLVRYQSLPEKSEGSWETEQDFLFTTEIKKPEELRATEIHFHAEAAYYSGKTFILVERRDLMRPQP